MSTGVAALTILAGRHASLDAAAWERVAPVVVPLEPTPLDRQPSAYVQAAWRERPRSTLAELVVQAAVVDRALHLRLRWPAPQPRPRITDYDVYADACGVLFPLDGRDAPLETMGSEEAPVLAWYWRAGEASPFVATARGPGTVAREPRHLLDAEAEWGDGAWTVQFSQRVSEPGAPRLRDGAIPVGFAVWTGALQERAGIKAHTPAWHRLEVPREATS